MLQIAVTNTNNWNQVWQFAIPSHPRRQVKDKLICPVLLLQPVIAIYFNCPEANTREWTVAGYINQQLQTGLTVGGNPIAITSGGCKLFLNQLQIITFPIQSEYALRLDIQAWITGGAEVTVWEYIGEIFTTEQPISSAQAAQLEQINLLLNNLINSF